MLDNSEMYRSLDFVRGKHAAQYRKGTDVPYVTHLENVGKLLVSAGCDTPTVVAGILHDIVEDTPVTLDEVRQLFGKEVMDLVAAATEQDKSLPWRQRKSQYLNMLERIPTPHLFIPCADKLDNISFLLTMLQERGRDYLRNFNAPEPELSWFYMTAADILNRRLSQSILAGMAADLLEKTTTAFTIPSTTNQEDGNGCGYDNDQKRQAFHAAGIF